MGNKLYIRERGEGGKSSAFLKITEKKCACKGSEQERCLTCVTDVPWEDTERQMAREQQKHVKEKPLGRLYSGLLVLMGGLQGEIRSGSVAIGQGRTV